jgi:hypothetical protein
MNSSFPFNPALTGSLPRVVNLWPKKISLKFSCDLGGAALDLVPFGTTISFYFASSKTIYGKRL